MAVISTGLTMNEKIKQFAEQAFRYSCEFAQDPNYSPHNPYNGLIEKERYDKKFAELIVRECIAQAVKEEERYDLFGSRDAGYCSIAMANFQGVLAEHFGVEE